MRLRKMEQLSLVGSQFVVQNNYALAQRSQDNKFVESGLGNWALVNLGYRHHRFKDSFNENTEIDGKRSSIREAFFLYQAIFLYVILNKLLFSSFSNFFLPFYIKDSLHYIALF